MGAEIDTSGSVSFGSPDIASLGRELFGADNIEPAENTSRPKEGGENEAGSGAAGGDEGGKPDKNATPERGKDGKPEGKPEGDASSATGDKEEEGKSESTGIVDDWDEGKQKDEEKKEEVPDSQLSHEDWRTKRLNVVASQRDQARREAEELRQRIAALEAGAQPQQQQQQPTPPPIVPRVDLSQAANMEAYRSQLSQEIAQKDPEIAGIDQQLAKIQEDAKAGKFASNMDYAAAYQPLITRREIAIRSKADAYLLQIQQQQQAPVLAQQRAAQAARQAQMQMLQGWGQKIAESTVPDAKKYQDRMVKVLQENPQAIHDHILAAIFTDDEPDLMTAAVMSKRKNVEELENISAVYAGKPIPPKVYARLYEMKRVAKDELSGAATARARKEAEKKLPDDIGSQPSSSEISDADFRKIMRGPNSRQKGAAALGLDIGF